MYPLLNLKQQKEKEAYSYFKIMVFVWLKCQDILLETSDWELLVEENEHS